MNALTALIALNDTIPHSTRRVLINVAFERLLQDRAWPDQQRDPLTPWLAILVEEVGEAARASLANKSDGPQDLRAELVQVAAVAVAWIETIDAANKKAPQ